MIYALLVVSVLLAIGLLALRSAFLVTTVIGSSMEPTLRSDDRFLVRKESAFGSGMDKTLDKPNSLRLKAPSSFI